MGRASEADERDPHAERLRGYAPRHKLASGLAEPAVVVDGGWGVRLWQLHGQVERYRRYWSVPRGEAGGLLYVALGDSTAQGIGPGRPSAATSWWPSGCGRRPAAPSG